MELKEAVKLWTLAITLVGCLAHAEPYTANAGDVETKLVDGKVVNVPRAATKPQATQRPRAAVEKPADAPAPTSASEPPTPSDDAPTPTAYVPSATQDSPAVTEVKKVRRIRNATDASTTSTAWGVGDIQFDSTDNSWSVTPDQIPDGKGDYVYYACQDSAAFAVCRSARKGTAISKECGDSSIPIRIVIPKGGRALQVVGDGMVELLTKVQCRDI